MSKVLLDTNGYSALLNGDQKMIQAIEKASRVYFSVFVLGELHAGFCGGNKEKENRMLLEDFLNHPSVTLIHTTEETAEIFGEIKTRLKKQGTPLPINDVWIAAHCFEHGCVLLTYDQHFQHIAGLRASL
jgi:tRNA(fMet)-specific endonuclease VapC